MAARQLHYPKIRDCSSCPGGQCIAFEKYDGTNTHFAWDRDFGWHAFGTRRDGFNLTEQGISEFSQRHQQLREVVSVFDATLAAPLDGIFRSHPAYLPFNEIVAFAEFHGPGSFAGLHKQDDIKTLTLFDIKLCDFGLLAPSQFVDDFCHLNAARVIFKGKFTGAFTEDVRQGKFNVAEGVVCKGGNGGEDLWMAKVKTDAYMDRLKTAFGNKWEQYWE